VERLLASLATERDTFTHDANGNQTRLDRTVSLDGTTTGTLETALTYDYRNQLTRARTSVPGGAITQEWENRYDAFGRRIARRNVQTGELIRYLYDGGRISEERGANPETASVSFHTRPQDSVEILADLQSPPVANCSASAIFRLAIASYA
jgi:hypothetical protein